MSVPEFGETLMPGWGVGSLVAQVVRHPRSVVDLAGLVPAWRAARSALTRFFQALAGSRDGMEILERGDQIT